MYGGRAPAILFVSIITRGTPRDLVRYCYNVFLSANYVVHHHHYGDVANKLEKHFFSVLLTCFRFSFWGQYSIFAIR